MDRLEVVTELLRISFACLPHLSKNIVHVSLLPLPAPIAGNLLMGDANQVATWPRSQVTRDGRFEVDTRLHGFIVPDHYFAINVLQPS